MTKIRNMFTRLFTRTAPKLPELPEPKPDPRFNFARLANVINRKRAEKSLAPLENFDPYRMANDDCPMVVHLTPMEYRELLADIAYSSPRWLEVARGGFNGGIQLDGVLVTVASVSDFDPAVD